MKNIMVLLALLWAIPLFPQQAKTVNVDKDRFNLLQEMALTDQYLDTVFVMGKVFFKNGNSSRAYLNYNLITNGITFLDEKNTAMTLMGLSEISLISYGSRAFVSFGNDQVAEIIESFPNGVSLLLNRKSEVKKSFDQRGPYGTSLELASTDRLTTVFSEAITTRIDQRVDVEISMKSNYILLKDGKTFPVNRLKDLRKIYPEKWDELREFVKENNMNPNNKDNVLAIIKFCNS